MSCIVFDTPGLIDIRAFTLMGVSAKPNTTNPIGMFGTGLKYAMATMVRLGAEPIVWIGKDKHTFFKRQGEFRGAPFEKLSMRRESFRLTKPRVTDLPYAVSYGRNWKPWMCFRELESNTRDEGGQTWHDTAPADMLIGNEGRTRIVIDHPEFEQAFRDIDDIFLPDAQREGRGVQVIDKPSNHIYWRGLRVAELQKPSQFTYNFLDQLDLTEDRTLAAVWMARQQLGNHVAQSDDRQFIEKVTSVGDKYWEHEVEPSQYTAPSRTFHDYMTSHPKRVGGSWHGYYGKWDRRVTEHTFDAWAAHPLPWRRENDTIVDGNNVTVLEAPFGYKGKWSLFADQLLTKINPITIEEEPEHDAGDDDSGDRPDADGAGEDRE